MSTLAPYSSLRDVKRRQLAEQLPLAMPMGMFIEPTNVCNFKCTFCPESFANYEETVGGRAQMDFATFEKIVADVKAMGRLKTLRFYMLGEPLLHPDLPRMIALARREGITERTELTSNATALTPKRARELIDAGLDYLRVSIYAVDQARNERVTQSKVTVERIYQNVRAFRELRDSLGATQPVLYVKMIDSCNEAENAHFLERYRPIADECVLEKPMNWNGAGEHDLLDSTYSAEEKAKLDESRLFPFKKEVCPFPFYTMVVNSNGDVTVCCVDWNKKTAVGNVRTETLSQIWHGARMREFRHLHLERRRSENESCRHCTYLHTLPDNLDSIAPEDFARVSE